MELRKTLLITPTEDTGWNPALADVEEEEKSLNENILKCSCFCFQPSGINLGLEDDHCSAMNHSSSATSNAQ